jgi:hypothetical protein
MVVLAVGLAPGVGCKKSSSTTPPPQRDDGPTTPPPADAPTLTIRVTAQADGNAGRPLYAVVRAVTLKDFVEDRYQDIAALVVEPDESVLASFVVFPGKARAVTIPKPEGKTVGVYCLLTEASGTSWKRLFEEAEVIEVVVGKDRLVR